MVATIIGWKYSVTSILSGKSLGIRIKTSLGSLRFLFGFKLAEKKNHQLFNLVRKVFNFYSMGKKHFATERQTKALHNQATPKISKLFEHNLLE